MFGRPAKVIISISFVLFLAILFKNQVSHPEMIFSNDFYGYTELGKNIFHELNFLVRWELDNLLIYPPLFPILIYIINFFTKNPLVSIQYLNAFSASFCLIPLFLVTRKLLNNISAFLVIIFMIYYFSLNKPCYLPYIDYFFTFLTIIVFWLYWGVLTEGNHKARHFILVGFMIGLTYLTKYHGIIYCLWTSILIFYFFRHNHYGIGYILKKISFLMLGLFPLVIIYNSFLYVNSRHQQVYDSASVGFFDGMGGAARESNMLNPEGTEFKLLSDCHKFTIVSFCMKYPRSILRSYRINLKKTFEFMTQAVFPFKFVEKPGLYITIQCILVVLILITTIYYKRRLSILYIFLFFSTVLFIPFFGVYERYLIPFIPFYFLLWLSGINALFNLFEDNRKFKNFRYIVKLSVILFATVLVYSYALKFHKAVFPHGQKKECPYKEYFRAAGWIKNDSKNKTGRAKIMSVKTTFAYLTNSYFIALPYEHSWERVIRFALMRNVDYIILDKKALLQKREDQWGHLTKTIPQNSHLRLSYVDTVDDNIITIFKINH